ncbi:MAG: efflux RND transporter permease subunit [Desulfobacterales bacterium]|nr:efflux RND transporter permease subunit [Desulfobacterales bacterium]
MKTYQQDMKSTLLRIYDKCILEHPILTLIVTFGVLVFFALQVPKFKLDASGDSLVLENDADLYYHRQITERYRANDILVLTYTAKDDLFSVSSLDDLAKLRDELRQLENVSSVTTILDVPLLLNSGVSLGDLADEENIKTLENSPVDKNTALAEFNDNPLYSGRLVSPDGKTTALLISLPFDETYRSLLKRRYELREKKYNNDISAGETQELDQVSHAYRQELTRLMHRDNQLVEDVRTTIDRHRDQADLYLGGVPMIVTDMIAFIENDLVVFGVGVMFFLIFTLAVIFRKLRWVILSMLCCLAAVLVMVGTLGMVDWRVTVISSNFISLMLILTMSLTIHLIERYLEVHAQSPDADQRTLVLETVRTIALPCLYTMLTTMVAFASLLVSGIRPVIDFGMMMTFGLMISFGLAFVMFPATVVLMKKDTSGAGEDFTHPFTLVFARITEKHGKKILALSIVLAVISTMGITKLKVENRFIDYFREKTEISQGMSLIDSKLGGTTPLDLIVDFKIEPVEFDAFEDDDDFWEDEEIEEEPDSWFSDVIAREEIEDIHDFLESLPETGEVLSLATLEKLTTRLNKDQPLDGFDFSILLKKIPQDLKELLVNPYVSEDIAQARFTMRIIESDKKLERKALLERMRDHLVNDLGYAESQLRFTNMFVLYNNMLQSLFQSQILTIGIVFLAIMLMFIVLFRSLRLAVIAIIPNLLPAVMVLGAMGWLGIPLNMMTITIASITIGIAVDDTIHYIHRFQKEFPRDRNYMATLYRCHRSIGRAMYYTSITIMIGFSILIISNFVPTIYFGLSTGFAMLVALLAALTLLPQLLILLKPLGPEAKENPLGPEAKANEQEIH